MAFVMAIGNGVLGECVEGISVEVKRNLLMMVLVCPGFFGFFAQRLDGSDVMQR